MIEFSAALQRVLDHVVPFEATRVPLAEAAGRVLLESVVADMDLPPFETTAMDGWAVRAADVASAPVALRIAGSLGAGGRAPGPLAGGETLKVMTGAPLPEGADAVVPVERSELLDDGRVRLDESAARGAHVRRRGEVLGEGQPLLSAGRRLTPADLVLAAAAGRESVRVARPARTAVLVTGDEVVPCAERPGPGRIRNTNEPLLSGALRRLGAEVRALGTAPDELEPLAAAFGRGVAAGPDFLLTTGGVSMGDRDLVGAALARLGAEILFHKVAIKPAKPVLVARLGATIVFALPGNPVSAAVGFDFFVRPAWRAASGLSPALPEPVEAKIAGPVRNRGPRRAFLPATLERDGTRLVARPVPTHGSHDVRAHALSDAYLDLPPDADAGRGDVVKVHPGTDEMTLG